MMRKGNSGVNVVMETRRRSKLVATNYPQNMLAQRRLCSTYTGIDKAKAKKLTEMDMQMRLMKYRQKNISSKKRMGNNLNETFFFQPGFRFRRNGDVRELHSGFTEVRLPDLENVFLAHRAGGLMCTVPHKHDETCRISAMSMDELDAEISKLSRELSNVKEDADKVISDHKEKTARHQPVNYLHAHTNDFTPDLEMVRSSSSVRSSIRPNCVACHFDIKASTSESELHRFLQRRNEHWTRWKIAPSGKYSNKSYVPNLMFSYNDIDKDESTSSTSSRSKSMNNVKAKQSTKGLTDKSIDAVFKANQTAFEKANLKKIETASSVRDQSTSDQSPKVPKKGVLKNKGKLNLNGTTSETKADKLRVKLLKMMVNQPNSELSVSEDAMYDDYFASSDTTPEWSLFPASDTVDEEPLRTERTDDTLANLTFRSQTFDSDRPVESTWSADSTDAYMGSNRSKKQVTFSQYNLRGHGSGQPQQVRSCCNRSVDDSLRPVDDSLKEEVDGEDSYESISAKDVLKEKAALQMCDTLDRVNVFMSRLPEVEPSLKTWRKSSGQRVNFYDLKDGILLQRTGSRVGTPQSESNELMDTDMRKMTQHRLEDAISCAVCPERLNFQRKKAYVSPWGKVNSELELLEKEKPDSIRSLMHCRYLRPYKMKFTEKKFRR